MELVYPHCDNHPTVVVSVEDCLTGNTFLFQMLLDTGADRTCFPAKFAPFFGHNNGHQDVKCHDMYGLGGVSKCYLHKLKVGLIDPVNSTPQNRIVIWKSKVDQIAFAEKFDAGYGLLGRDLMREWKSVKFSKNGIGGVITIII